MFSKSFELLCPSPEYKITFLTPSKNFEAYFLDFDIFHRFSPNTYFLGWTATTAATVAATAAEEFPQTSSPHSHHAQGSHIPFGHPPSLVDSSDMRAL